MSRLHGNVSGIMEMLPYQFSGIVSDHWCHRRLSEAVLQRVLLAAKALSLANRTNSAAPFRGSGLPFIDEGSSHSMGSGGDRIW